jgi:chorismate mutase/prephenate dehydrogenase
MKDTPQKDRTEKKRQRHPQIAHDSTQESAQLEIGNLRQHLDDIDRKIVFLLSERQREVERIVSLKRAHNLPVYHPAREEDLISGRRRQGQEAGLDPDFIEDLYRRILKQSRVEQTAHLARKGVRPGAKILLVGGMGSMGDYFRRWFSDANYKVRILGRANWADLDTLCAAIDLAILAVPINVTTEVARRLAPHLPAESVLADITSIKVAPMKAMLEAHAGPVIGLHPLFGPTTSTMDKQIVVFTPGRDPHACQWVLDQFAAWGNILVQADPQEHDDIMGIVQALRHFATFVFGQFLRRRQVDLHRTLEFSSPIYRLELVMVGRLFAQDPSLYADIIFASPERRALLRDYLESLNSHKRMLEDGSEEQFCAEFRKTAEWFAPFSEQAIRESSFLIDKLIERF